MEQKTVMQPALSNQCCLFSLSFNTTH